MPKQDWAPEPWHAKPLIDERFYLEDTDHVAIGHLYDDGSVSIDKATADRIAACVSACAGVPTKWLESLTKGEIKLFIEEHITKEASDARD